MTYSPGEPPRPSGAAEDSFDVGLLSPVWAGTTGEALTGDQAVVDAMVRAEAALLHALADTGIAPGSARATAAKVAAVAAEPRPLALAAVAGGNPVIPLLELLREDLASEHAGWVHHGATSQDIIDTALMLVSSAVARAVEADLTRLAATLATLADGARAVPMVARTLTPDLLFQSHSAPLGLVFYEGRMFPAEYKGDAFNGKLNHKLLICRYNWGSDLIAIGFDEKGNVISAQSGFVGMSNFESPLDVTEDLQTGNLYVSEYGAQKVTLLKPVAPGVPLNNAPEPTRTRFRRSRT